MAKKKKQEEQVPVETGQTTDALKVGNVWSEPGIVSGDTESAGNIKLDQTEQGVHKAGGRAKENTRILEQEMHDRPKTSINPWQNSDYARDGGQYGRLNNRNYNTTLRLAREADRYNQAPRENLMVFGNGYKGGMGTQKVDRYEKPELETMETRAMDQSWKLDTNQKQLAQALQDAVNHKDLDAFQMAYKQLFGIELDEEAAMIEMNKLVRQLEEQNILTKDRDRFMAYFQRAFGSQTAAMLYNMTLDNNPFAAVAAQALGLPQMPTFQEIQEAGAFKIAYDNTLKDLQAGDPKTVKRFEGMGSAEIGREVAKDIGIAQKRRDEVYKMAMRLDNLDYYTSDFWKDLFVSRGSRVMY